MCSPLSSEGWGCEWTHPVRGGAVSGPAQCVTCSSLSSDLDLASLKAVSSLLKGLPLQVDQREGDFTEEKTKLFKK